MKNKLLISLLIFGAVTIMIGIYGINSQKDHSVKTTTSEVSRTSNELNALPIPALLEDKNPEEGISDYYLNVQKGTTNFMDDLLTPTLGYNGNYLGPVLKTVRGEEINMHISNELNDTTSVHWHGLETNGPEDGGPRQIIGVNSTWEPSFTINQPAATLWFHPHVIGTTATQVYQGLAGLIIIEDENSKSLNLPDDYGDNDIPLIIQDRSFNEDGTFVYANNMMNGAVGDKIIVNGAITPYLDVKQMKYRFRIVDGANASNYNLRLSDDSEFYQIASDGGLLEKPIESKKIFVSPGERAEIIIDFDKYQEGDVVELLTDTKLVMTFRIGEAAEDLTVIPERLTEIEKIDESLVTSVKTIELDGMGHMVSINGRKFDMNRIDDNVTLGDIEIWEITSNSTMMGKMGHPFHIHGTQFQILSRDGKEPPLSEQGWKDTVFVQADETVRIIVKFNYKGVFMYHCHILEHEEAGMMGQLEVIEQ